MGFFDLNIPYLESDRNATDKSTLNDRRLRLARRVMELGYTGVAYNRTLKGVMSESHRCSTTLFPISKLVPISSSFFAAVKLRRELLNVAVASPFRQYTRLTVIVDNPSQSASLNAGNPILKSYDIVAVRPTNQIAFDQACQTAEVDMISVDFSSEKFQIRLHRPMVKAAIERGVYFEITYHGLIADEKSRSHMISNCKLLVDWTRGKNLIFCSAAASATEIRGPLDVSNLFSLLGVHIEHAKAAVSKNCRSLLANALRKKHFYKEAVKVEQIPPGGQGFDDWLKWDPISSGEGDLLSDDMEKAFALSNTLTQTAKKPISFTSNINGLPSHGLQIRDSIPVPEVSAMKIEKKAVAVEKPEEHRNSLPENRSVFSTLSLSKEHANQTSKVLCQHVPSFEEARNSPNYAKIGFQASGFESSVLSPLSTYNDTCTNAEETVSVSSEKLNHSNETEDSASQVKEGDALHDGARVDITDIKMPITDNHASIELPSPFKRLTCSSASQLKESDVENRRDLGLHRHGGVVDMVSDRVDSDNKQVAPFDASSVDAFVEGEQYSEIGSLNPRTDFNGSISDDVMGQPMQIDSVDNYQGLGKSQAGREKRKRNSPHKPLLFPLKRNLNPRHLKRKSRK